MPVHHDRREVITLHERHATRPHICTECEGSGWRDIKSPDDTPGYGYCSCTIGRRKAQEARARKERERQAEHDANLPW